VLRPDATAGKNKESGNTLFAGRKKSVVEQENYKRDQRDSQTGYMEP